MSSVYDFHDEDEMENDDETVEAGVTGESTGSDSCYNYTKDLLSFSTWSLTLSGQGKICINLDGIDIDTYVKVKYPDINYKFGAVAECGLSSDETCIKFLGGAGCTVELLWTDHVMGTKLFYKQLDCSSVTNFCECLSQCLKNEQNVFMHAAQSKFLGTFEVDIQKLSCSSSKNAVRSIDHNYVCRLYINAKIMVQNGNFKEFPPAIGTVDIGDDSLELYFQSEGIVEIVDGNHTLIAQKRLCEEIKDIQSLKTRRVAIYQNLTRQEALALGLCANENASISKPTTQYEQATLIRQELFSSIFQGQASSHFYRHIYQLFNAVCPNNKDEENRRQKRLRTLIRIAAFDQECWDLISKIQKEKPNQGLYIYNELMNVSAINAKIILEEVIRKKQKLSEISKKCKQLPKESSEDSASQRIRRPKGVMTATTEKEKDKKDMNEELKSLQEQVQTLQTENTRLKYQLEEKVGVLQATVKENSRLKETVKECREELEQQNTELEVLGMKLDNYDFALQEHRKENEKLNEALKLARQIPRIQEYFSEEEIKSLPFSVEGMTVEKTTVKRKNEAGQNTSQRTKEKKLEPNCHVISPKTIGLVEYNAGAIYMGLLEGQHMTYCKKPLGKLENGNFEFQFADGLETTLNMKDIQKINEMYLITKFKLEVVNNQISVTEKEHEQIKEAIAIYTKS